MEPVKDQELSVKTYKKGKKSKRHFFASGKWYKIALTLILWSVLQEIIMASTDLIDNVFVNHLREEHVYGYDAFKNMVLNESGWTMLDYDLLKSVNLESYYGNGILYLPGQIGVNAVSASNQLFILMFSMVSGFCYGAGIFSAQYFGAGDYQRLKQITALKMYLVISITGVFALFGLPGVTEKLIAFTTHPNYDIVKPDFSAPKDGQYAIQLHKYIQNEVAKMATQQGATYYRIVSLSYPLLTINQVAVTALRETRRPFYSFFMSAISLVANFTCNVFLTAPTFIPGFIGFGIEGSAAGTVASRVLQTVFIFVLLGIKKFEFIPSIKHFKIERTVLRVALIKSMPILLNETLFALGQVVQVKLRAMYSVDSLSANAMYETMLMAFFSPMYHGLNAGISVLVGNELGAQNFDKAQYNAKHLMRLSFMIATGFLMIFSGLSFVLPKLIFPNITKEGLRIGQWMIFIYTMTYPIILLNSCVYSILRAGGNVINAFLMDSGFNWVLQIPTLCLLILGNTEVSNSGFITLGIISIHLIICMFEVVKVIPATIFYFRRKWVRSIIVAKNVSVETDKNIGSFSQEISAESVIENVDLNDKVER
ncbi:MATE efflux family protein [Spiroplasma chinense]|uniref:MATE efflux family protein n=1 Tax=Spiroplasma chinense TaxID=216932 RepID=A0A5B9Y428_9MOLU|nr:MATE family efflux transporter [Spiroplasma chinense]QEH61426.1 MATE efflux family protein [Spiroplasma chinense]